MLVVLAVASLAYLVFLNECAVENAHLAQPCSSLDALRAAGLAQTGSAWPVFMHFRRRGKTYPPPPATSTGTPSSSRAPVITITTPLTLNRMGRLASLAATWQGPVSAALFLCNVEDLVTAAAAYDRSQDLRDHVDLHVVVGAARYFPVNAVRNVALNGSTSEFYMYQDVDGIPSAPMASFGRDLVNSIQIAEADGMFEDRTTFVVPALEFSSSGASEEVEGVVDKDALHALWRKGAVQTMHPCCFGYAGPFKINDWFSTPTGYPIEYEQSFEPYFIQKAPVFLFDERFVGRHHNKHSLFFAMYAAGYRLHVLSQSWIMDAPHGSGQEGNSGGVEPGNKLKWATFLKETADKYHLQCPARGPCWWRDEDVDHRSPLWAVYEAFLHMVSC